MQFRRAWVEENSSSFVLNIITNGYVLPFHLKPKLTRHPLIISEYKNQQKDRALASCIQSLLHKHAIEKVRNTESLGFYSRLFLVPKPHQYTYKTPTSIFQFTQDPENTYHLHTGLRSISSPLFTSIRASPSSSSIHHDSKRGKTHGLITGHKDTSMSGRLADQGSISGGVISQHKSGGRPNRISRLDDKSGQIGIDSNSSMLFYGYEYHLNSALVKPTQEK